MEKLSIKHQTAEKSLNSLKSILDLMEKKNFLASIDTKTDERFKIVRDSVIQRFEYSVDTVWKYLKEYLQLSLGIVQTHPKPVFRECLSAKLINEEDVEKLIRNGNGH